MQCARHHAPTGQNHRYHVQPRRAIKHHGQGPQKGQQAHRQPDQIDDRECVPGLQNPSKARSQHDSGHGQRHDPDGIEHFRLVRHGADESQPPGAHRSHQCARNDAEKRDHCDGGNHQGAHAPPLLAFEHHRKMLRQRTAESQVKQAQVADDCPDQRQQPKPCIPQFADENRNAEYCGE